MTTRDEREDQRGIALPMALWAAMAIALLAATVATVAGQAVRRQAGQDSIATARALLDTGISQGVMRAVHPDPALHLRPDGRPVSVQEPEGRLTLRLWDEAGRLDLNRTPVDRITAVAGRLLGPDETAALGASLTRRRRDGPAWHSVMELGSILGPEGFARLQPLVTVYGLPLADGRVDIGKAPAALLALWSGLSDVDPVDRAALSAIGLVDGGPPSSLFTLRVEARLSGGTAASAEAVIWATIDGAQAYRVLEWREPAPALLVEDGSP